MIRKALYVSLSIYLYIYQVPPSIAAKIATSWRWKMSTLASTSRISMLSHSLVLCSLMEGHSIMRCTGVYRYCWSHLPQTAGWLKLAKRPSHPMPYSTINSNISHQTETNFCHNTFAKVREIFCRKHHITTVINSWRQTDSFRGNSFWWFYAVMALELLACFSPFQHNRTHAAETDAGSGWDDPNSSYLAHSPMVSNRPKTADRNSEDTASRCPDTATRPELEASTKIHEASGHAAVRESLQAEGLTDDIIDIILASWRASTHRQYKTYIQKWVNFCNSEQTSLFSPSVNDVLTFLSKLFHESKLGYSAMNTARSAISSIATISDMPAGKHPLVRRFLKGVFNKKPTLPCYNVTWDVQIVLDYLTGN